MGLFTPLVAFQGRWSHANVHDLLLRTSMTVKTSFHAKGSGVWTRKILHLCHNNEQNSRPWQHRKLNMMTFAVWSAPHLISKYAANALLFQSVQCKVMIYFEPHLFFTPLVASVLPGLFLDRQGEITFNDVRVMMHSVIYIFSDRTAACQSSCEHPGNLRFHTDMFATSISVACRLVYR